MKRFRFRLDPILALRALAERSARERLGVAQHALGAAEDLARLAEERRVAVAEALAAARATTFRPAEQAGGLHALATAGRVAQEAARRRDEAAAARDRARPAWGAARRDLQALERLEQRARLAHREAAEKSEQALLDELASLAAARGSRSPV
jgi:flagellar export protein FliJ